MAKTPAQRAAKHGESATPPQTPVVNTSTQRSPQKAQGNANLILIAGSAASLLLFWYFHMLTLQQLTDLSDGLAMPQSMVFGFDVAHVEALRSAMDADALGQLNYVQKTAGTLFALVFAFSAMTMVAVQVRKKAARWLLWFFPVAFAGISLWANASIDSMLGAETLSEGAVSLSSTLVSLSWLLLILSLVSIAVALFLGRRKKLAPAQS